MTKENEIEPWLGGRRWARSHADDKYFHAISAVASRAGFVRPSSRVCFKGTYLGRGTAAAAALCMPERYPGFRSRHAVVKTKIVRFGRSGMAAALSHLRYIERDGVSRSGEPGCVYSAVEDHADGRTFLKRCNGDRHQFRIIVSLADGAEYDDLTPLIRRFTARIEDDLGTSLDWIAANHADTLHPHTHMILRGRDDRGEDLVIAPAYMTHGLRERLRGLVSLDLGPCIEPALARPIQLEVEAERLTSLDRRLIQQMDGERIIVVTGHGMRDHCLLNGRLQKLGALGFAERLSGGRWRLNAGLEEELRALEERAEMARTLNRDLRAAGLERAPTEQVVHAPELSVELTGRIVRKGFADELSDREYLVLDGVDGRGHYIEIGGEGRGSPFPEGSIVKLCVGHAAEHGRTQRIVKIDLLSPVRLEQLPTHNGATWLDRELVHPSIAPRNAGFGRDVRSALARRRLWLIEQGLAAQVEDQLTCRRDMISVLEQRELGRTTTDLEEMTGLAFASLADAREVRGVFQRRLDLGSGRYAMIENGHEFTLVPWQPEFERHFGKPVRAASASDGISWTIGRDRGIEI